MFDYTPHSLRKWLFQSISLPGGAVIERQYETNAWLSLTRLKQSGGTVLNSHAYTYDQNGRPTRQTRQGGDYVDYTYDPTGQLLSALGQESGGSINRLNERYGYAYDAGGNLLRRTNSVSATTPLVQTFTVNDRNELTNVTRSGTLTVAGTSSSAATSVTVSANGGGATNTILYTGGTFARPGVSLANGNNTFTAVGTDASGRQSTHAITVNLPSTVTFNYDDNGNLLTDGRRSFTYDDENQLLSVSVASAWKSEFAYDGLSRRRVRKEYAWVSGAWQQTNEVRYVYDGPLVVQERDRLNVPQVTYTRGPDLSGRLFGAGGIGGLLARTESAGSAYYHNDLGGNVTALVNGNQAIVARYLYDAYGNVLSQSGPLAEANLYRFSSKEVHPASGLSYYLYRYYDPNLQRWINRDPVGERGGVNLFQYVFNQPVALIDLYGLDAGGRVGPGYPFDGYPHPELEPRSTPYWEYPGGIEPGINENLDLYALPLSRLLGPLKNLFGPKPKCEEKPEKTLEELEDELKKLDESAEFWHQEVDTIKRQLEHGIDMAKRGANEYGLKREIEESLPRQIRDANNNIIDIRNQMKQIADKIAKRRR